MKYVRLVAVSLLGSAIFLGLAGRVQATSLAGVDFPEEISLGAKKLLLNGVGKRRIAFFTVYAAGLYLEKKSDNPEEILASSEIKYLRMHFLREASKSRIQGAFEDGLKDNCKESFANLKERMQGLLAQMTTLHDGDEMLLSFFPDHVEIKVKDSPVISVPGADFSKALPALWLGPKPPNEDLKKGLLGLKSK